MATYYRVDPNRNQPPQFYVIDQDADINQLKARNFSSCQGNLQDLDAPAFVSGQNYKCLETGHVIDTSIYSTNP
ncbi:MAG: hypothetical protein JST32_13410 [Bacteroidetes bacterium]|nr:hypothetical protein [Bacteroidota bacterium]